MILPGYAAKKAKIEREVEKLKRQIELLENKNRKPVIATIVRSMKEYEISLEEISAAYNKTPTRTSTKTRVARKSSGGPRGPVPPKYRDPETGITWTGRGKAPRWVTEAESQGKSRDQFLIEPAPTPSSPSES